MKQFALLLFSLSTLFYCHSQKVVKVKVTSSANIETSINECKNSGKSLKYGSKNSELNNNSGSLTLWKAVGNSTLIIECDIKAERINETTSLTFRMPHVPGVLATWKKEVKKIIKNLELPDLMVGEYFDGIE